MTEPTTDATLTGDEIAERLAKGDRRAYDEAMAHPEAWREMTDEEIMAAKVSFKDLVFGGGVILYGAAAVMLVLFFGYILVSAVFGG